MNITVNQYNCDFKEKNVFLVYGCPTPMKQECVPRSNRQKREQNLVKLHRKSSDEYLARCAQSFILHGPSQPKRAKSGYLIYMHEKSALMNKNLSYSEISRIAGGEFDKLDEHQKDFFEDLSVQDRLRYDAEIRVYNQKYLEYKAKWKCENEMPLQRLREVRARSAYNYFAIEYSKNKGGTKRGELSAIWTSLSMEEKQKYFLMSDEDKKCTATRREETRRKRNKVQYNFKNEMISLK